MASPPAKKPAAKKPVAKKSPAKPSTATKTTLLIEFCRDLMERGHRTAAREQLESLLRRQPTNADAIVLLAQDDASTGDVEAAKKRLLQADLARPGHLAARMLHAELLAGEDDLDGALNVLFEAAEWNPTDGSILQEIAALTRDHKDYVRLRRQWLTARTKGMKAASGARAVAKAAALVEEFPAAFDIYRWLISGQLEKIAKDKAQNLVRPPKESAGRVGDGKGEQALKDLKTVLDKSKTPFFLISGTLLGYLRDGQMLPGDKDIDVGVFQEDYNHVKLLQVFRRSPLFTVKRLDNLDRLRIAHVNGVWVDVFPHYREGDVIWHDGTASRWWNTPFEIGKMKIKSVDYAVPEPPERYLDENYGDWRTPISLFDVRYEAPNAEVRSADYMNLLIYIRVYEALVAFRWDVVAKYARDFPDLFNDDPLLDQARTEGQSIVAHVAAVQRAISSGQTPPRFPEAGAVKPVAAKPAAKAVTNAAQGATASTPHKNPNHVRVAKWFKKRVKRVTGQA